MPEKIPLHEKTYLSSLSDREKKEIEEKVNFELELTNYNTLKKMTVVGGVANALAGLFVVWVLYYQIKHTTLFNWYSMLITIVIINIAWSSFFAYRYKDITIELLKKWHSGLYIILAVLCLTWGFIGVLFITPQPYYQLFVITFLQIAILCFGFGTVVDFPASIITISCLTLPTIGFRIYEAMQHVGPFDQSYVLKLAFGISLLILGAFLLVVCYIGYLLTKSQATLSFLNAALNEKLEDMNKFLEQRVKERTIELENSLKLVTYQATHDLLTDLPNQRLLLEYITAAIKSADQNNHMFAVVFFTLNEIEKINDGLGHHIGDLVIKTVAQRFQKVFEKDAKNLAKIQYSVTLSRKDVFVILIEPIFQIEEIEEKVKPLFSIIDESIFTENQVIKLTASIGISLYPRNGTEMSSLLMNADAAMLRARQYGGNSLNMYKAEINADISKQLELESNLHSALKNSEFMLQYQPFIDLKKREICGSEALVRWENPTLGFISPANFIPLAEANGIIIPLGEWVLRKACMQTKLWHQLGFTSLKVAVNLSAKQLQQKNLLETVAEVIKETGIDPKFIELELTETAAFQDEVIPTLKQFTAMGFGLSIDDFGTGYSGLSNLKQFQIDKLKIDKSFVQDIDVNIHSKAIVSNIIAMAKKLKITVLAEGVETKEQLNALLDLGCDMIQGYYFSTPLNADVFTELLLSKKRYDF